MAPSPARPTEQIAKQVTLAVFAIDIHHDRTAGAIVQHNFQAEKVQVEWSEFKVKYVARAEPGHADDVCHRGIQKIT